MVTTRLGQQAIGVRPYAGFVAKTEAVFIPLEGNIVFGQHYYMIHPPGETLLRPTSTTEFTIRKRDKRPIVFGGGDG